MPIALFIARESDAVKQILTSCIYFIYPPLCAHCNAPSEQLICQSCWESLIPYNASHVIQLNTLSPNHISSHTACHAIWQYSPELQTILHQLKYNWKTSLATPLGNALALLLQNNSLFSNIDLIIPIPLHWFRRRRRGYNQSELISQIVSLNTSIPVDVHSLKRIRYTKSQTKLTIGQRQKNVTNAFRVVKPHRVMGRTIVLIDDVITTGSTVEACARTLMAAGAKQVAAFSIAHA